MKWTSILAIYTLVWIACAFVQLPFGVRTHDEAGIAKVRGQADSAPADFRPGRIALRACLIAAAVTALFVANYSYGWITVADLDFYPDAPHEAAYDEFDNRA